jgi:hypothetical protein
MARKVSLSRLREEVKRLAEETAARRRAAEGRSELHRMGAWLYYTKNGRAHLGAIHERMAAPPQGPTPGSPDHLRALARQLFPDDLIEELQDAPSEAPGGPQAAPGPADGPAGTDAATAKPGAAEGQPAGGSQLQTPVPAATAGSLPMLTVHVAAPGFASAASGPRGAPGVSAAAPGAAAATPRPSIDPAVQAAGLALWNAQAGDYPGPPPSVGGLAGGPAPVGGEFPCWL